MDDSEMTGGARRFTLRSAWMLWLGLLAFGAANVVVTFAGGAGLFDDQLVGAIVLVVVVAALAGLAFYKGWLLAATGLLAGYGLMGLVSSGACTYWTPMDLDALAGLLFYGGGLAVLLIALTIARLVQATRR